MTYFIRHPPLLQAAPTGQRTIIGTVRDPAFGHEPAQRSKLARPGNDLTDAKTTVPWCYVHIDEEGTPRRQVQNPVNNAPVVGGGRCAHGYTNNRVSRVADLEELRTNICKDFVRRPLKTSGNCACLPGVAKHDTVHRDIYVEYFSIAAIGRNRNDRCFPRLVDDRYRIEGAGCSGQSKNDSKDKGL
jgi:hypothetical protein